MCAHTFAHYVHIHTLFTYTHAHHKHIHTTYTHACAHVLAQHTHMCIQIYRWQGAEVVSSVNEHTGTLYPHTHTHPIYTYTLNTHVCAHMFTHYIRTFVYKFTGDRAPRVHHFLWINFVTHMNASFHTRERGMWYICISHIKHVNESCHAFEWVCTHLKQACHALEGGSVVYVHPICTPACVSGGSSVWVGVSSWDVERRASVIRTRCLLRLMIQCTEVAGVVFGWVSIGGM